MQTAWVEVTTSTQRQLVRLLDDKNQFVQTDGGKVVLDLRPIIIQLGDQVVVIGRVAEKLPDSAGKITIIDESQLETAQTITKILRAVANWMWLVALAVAALAIWLARGRRRIELRALAIGVLLVGLLMLAVRRVAGGYLVDQLAKDDSVKPAVRDAWSILTQVLADRAWVWITLGVVTLVGVWFVGETDRAAQARRAAQPVLQNRVTTYAHRCGLPARARARRSTLRARMADVARSCSPSSSSASRSSETSPCEKRSSNAEHTASLLGQRQRRRSSMPLAIGWFVWGGLLGVLYLIALITAGVMTIRNGHLVLFIVGFIFPLLWIIGAFMDKPRY